MSQYQDEPNTGKVWGKNPHGNPNAPDFKIEFNVMGGDYVLAIWRRRQTDNQNGPLYRFKIEQKEQQRQAAEAARDQFRAELDQPDDGVPF